MVSQIRSLKLFQQSYFSQLDIIVCGFCLHCQTDTLVKAYRLNPKLLENHKTEHTQLQATPQKPAVRLSCKRHAPKMFRKQQQHPKHTVSPAAEIYLNFLHPFLYVTNQQLSEPLMPCGALCTLPFYIQSNLSR